MPWYQIFSPDLATRNGPELVLLGGLEDVSIVWVLSRFFFKTKLVSSRHYLTWNEALKRVQTSTKAFYFMQCTVTSWILSEVTLVIQVFPLNQYQCIYTTNFWRYLKPRL